MEPNEKSGTVFGQILRFFRSPIVGPIAFGAVFGGTPIGFVLSWLGKNLNSPEYLRYMLDVTPLAILVAMVGTVICSPPVRKRRIVAALLTSSGAWVPIPLIVLITMELLWGFSIFNPPYLIPFLIMLFAFWGIIAAIPALVLSEVLLWLSSRGKPLG